MPKNIILRKFILKFFSLITIITLILTQTSCTFNKKKYSADYMDYLDTYSTFTAYTSSKAEFDKYSNLVETQLKKYHQLFDIYNNYDNLNNLKTINDNAGITPVVVDSELVKLLIDCKMYYKETNGKFNIAMGSILKLWHDCREKAINNPETASIPNLSDLENAKKHIDISALSINEENNEIFITDKDCSLDLGGIAKGYTAQQIVDSLKSAGLTSGILNLGGNVYAIGKPLESNKDSWVIGIESSDENNETILADKIKVTDTAIVSSGDYQRYFIVDNKKYHHIIDPDTLMPSTEFKAVSVIHKDSTIADMLSTSIFLLSYEDGKALLEKYNAEGIWFFNNDFSNNSNNNIKYTDGYKALKSE